MWRGFKDLALIPLMINLIIHDFFCGTAMATSSLISISMNIPINNILLSNSMGIERAILSCAVCEDCIIYWICMLVHIHKGNRAFADLRGHCHWTLDTGELTLKS